MSSRFKRLKLPIFNFSSKLSFLSEALDLCAFSKSSLHLLLSINTNSFMMEEDYQEKHTCKFCYKSFSNGRSLGGHMRSHMINVSSDDHQKHKGKLKLPKKKLPPLVNFNVDVKTGVLSTHKENPNKTTKSYEADTLLLQVKICKVCGKSFQSGQALFGHMKCHSVNGKTEDEEDSWNSCNVNDDYVNQVNDSQLDYEAATPSIKRKRSDRTKRYKANQHTTSSSVSEIDQQEQEEVALSLIMLSRETGKCVKFKKFNDRGLNPAVDCSNFAKIDDLNDSEVDSPKKVIKKSRFDRFESLPYNPQRSELSQEDYDKKNKFECTVCRKVFPSYQALGGHRASHKKYKGCCAPTNSNSPEAEISPNPSFEGSQSLTGGFTKSSPTNEVRSKRNKEHDCPICFKAFPSGQALVGHKRSHLIGGLAKTGSSEVNDNQMKETQHFLDLNLPAPVEDEEEEFTPWWIESNRHKHKAILSFFSS